MRAASALLIAVVSPLALARTVDVANVTELRAAVRDLEPGSTIRLAPGTYPGGLFIENLRATADRPVIIESSDPDDVAIIAGGAEGIHLTDVAHVIVRQLAIRGQTGNGINIDDGGTYESPSHHVTIEEVAFRDIGPKGNHDALKLSGVNDIVVRRCTFDGWAGQAIDMVGCHRGRIENCRFSAVEGFDNTTGPQAKGGSREILITGCRFTGPIGRAVNIGGSTGLQYFRPPDVRTFEAKDVTVQKCTFEGVDAPVAFVGIDGSIFRDNTIKHPRRWVLRILQETTADGFVPCRNGHFENNTIVFRRSDVREVVNIGPKTDPKSFVFKGNKWFCADNPARSKPALPSPEENGTYGVDPSIKPSG